MTARRVMFLSYQLLSIFSQNIGICSTSEVGPKDETMQEVLPKTPGFLTGKKSSHNEEKLNSSLPQTIEKDDHLIYQSRAGAGASETVVSSQNARAEASETVLSSQNAQPQDLIAESSDDFFFKHFKEGSFEGGKKGYKTDDAHKKKQNSKFSKGDKKGFKKKKGKKFNSLDHQKDYHGSYKKGQHKSKGQKKGFIKSHKRGHRDKGFKEREHEKKYGFRKTYHDKDQFAKLFGDNEFIGHFLRDSDAHNHKKKHYEGSKHH